MSTKSRAFVLTDKELEIASKLLEAYKLRTEMFTDYQSAAENDIGLDRELYFNYITLTNAIDYEKYNDPNKLWSASKEWVQTSPWLFDPQELFNKRTGEVVEAFRLIAQQYSGLFRPKDIGVWLPAVEVLLRHGGTLRLLRSYRLDAKAIMEAFTGADKSEFPILSGKKTLPRWLRILWEDAKVPLKNIDSVPLPVDRSIAQATYALIFKSQLRGFLDKQKKDKVQSVWRQIAITLNTPLISFDAPLRFIGLNPKSLNVR